MKFLVIGLGSMGKRRIRNLQALGYTDITGFDSRQDRCIEAKNKYNIKITSDLFNSITNERPDSFIISTSPESHMKYAMIGHEHKISCFIEASVTEADKILALHEATIASGVFIAPSCTMKFFDAPLKLKELILAEHIGKPLNFNYQTGQWLPNWHPWENIQDYYVSNPITGACREIVPFELTWLNDIFGNPNPIRCLNRKISSLQADINDIYHFWLEYPNNVLGAITVEILSQPFATRELRIIGDAGQIVYSADQNCIKVSTINNDSWEILSLANDKKENGYINPEEPYIREISAYTQALINKNPALFPNTLKMDFQTLKILEQLEEIGS